jgi:hypothetical protein
MFRDVRGQVVKVVDFKPLTPLVIEPLRRLKIVGMRWCDVKPNNMHVYTRTLTVLGVMLKSANVTTI